MHHSGHTELDIGKVVGTSGLMMRMESSDWTVKGEGLKGLLLGEERLERRTYIGKGEKRGYMSNGNQHAVRSTALL